MTTYPAGEISSFKSQSFFASLVSFVLNKQDTISEIELCDV